MNSAHQFADGTRVRFATPRSRIAVSIFGAIIIHVLILAAVWPWVKPFVLSAAPAGEPQRIDRRAIEAAIDGLPIISGDMTVAPSLADDSNYASQPWQIAVAIPASDARLPFSFAAALTGSGREMIQPPRRSLIAPAARPPTISP